MRTPLLFGLFVSLLVSASNASAQRGRGSDTSLSCDVALELNVQTATGNVFPGALVSAWVLSRTTQPVLPPMNGSEKSADALEWPEGNNLWQQATDGEGKKRLDFAIQPADCLSARQHPQKLVFVVEAPGHMPVVQTVSLPTRATRLTVRMMPVSSVALSLVCGDAPCEGATVDLVWHQGDITFRSQTTPQDGLISVDGFPSGNVEVNASYRMQHPEESIGHTTIRIQAQTPSEQRLALRRVGGNREWSAQILDRSRNPFSGATVHAECSGVHRGAVTNQEGFFSLAALPDQGSCTLEVERHRACTTSRDGICDRVENRFRFSGNLPDQLFLTVDAPSERVAPRPRGDGMIPD